MLGASDNRLSLASCLSVSMWIVLGIVPAIGNLNQLGTQFLRRAYRHTHL